MRPARAHLPGIHYPWDGRLLGGSLCEPSRSREGTHRARTTREEHPRVPRQDEQRQTHPAGSTRRGAPRRQGRTRRGSSSGSWEVDARVSRGGGRARVLPARGYACAAAVRAPTARVGAARGRRRPAHARWVSLVHRRAVSQRPRHGRRGCASRCIRRARPSCRRIHTYHVCNTCVRQAV